MTNKHWAVFALSDIKSALDEDRYDVAACHLSDAISAILARDAQDAEGIEAGKGPEPEYCSDRM